MYEIIEAAEGIDESAVPSHAYVPTAAGEHVPVQGGEVPGVGGSGGSGVRAGGGAGAGSTVFDADKQ
jgi:hypothetical protein